MPKKTTRRSKASKVTVDSLARDLGLLRSTLRIGIQELQAGLTQNREETRSGFDQLYRHIDGFVKLHETPDIEMKVLKEQMNRLEQRVNRLEVA